MAQINYIEYANRALDQVDRMGAQFRRSASTREPNHWREGLAAALAGALFSRDHRDDELYPIGILKDKAAEAVSKGVEAS